MRAFIILITAFGALVGSSYANTASDLIFSYRVKANENSVKTIEREVNAKSFQSNLFDEMRLSIVPLKVTFSGEGDLPKLTVKCDELSDEELMPIFRLIEKYCLLRRVGHSARYSQEAICTMNREPRSRDKYVEAILRENPDVVAHRLQRLNQEIISYGGVPGPNEKWFVIRDGELCWLYITTNIKETGVSAHERAIDANELSRKYVKAFKTCKQSTLHLRGSEYWKQIGKCLKGRYGLEYRSLEELNPYVSFEN